MSFEDADFIEVAPVKDRPRWRLAYCHACSDGYRGGCAKAEAWAREHFDQMHGVKP